MTVGRKRKMAAAIGVGAAVGVGLALRVREQRRQRLLAKEAAKGWVQKAFEWAGASGWYFYTRPPP